MHGAGSVPAGTAEHSTRRSRSGGARRGLPTGRALVGGLLVTVAAVVVFAAYAGAQDGPSATVVLARHQVDPGQRLTADDLELRAVDLPADVAGRAFTAVEDLVGAVTLAPLSGGELVQASAVRRASATTTGPEFSFPVDRDRALDGDIRAGETVELLATFGSGEDAYTTVLARDARVLGVQEARSGGLGASGRLVLTVGLASNDQVLDVAHASQVGVITVVRSTGVVGPAGRDRTSSPSATGAETTGRRS